MYTHDLPLNLSLLLGEDLGTIRYSPKWLIAGEEMGV